MENVSVAGAVVLVRGGALLLDVREDNEFDALAAPGARHVPLSRIDEVVGDASFDTTIICVCRSGARSARAAAHLKSAGRRVYNLEGAVLAWASSGEVLVGNDQPRIL